MSATERLRVTAARAVNRGNLIAVVDVQFGGLEIRDLTILRGVNGLFVGMPRKPRVDQVGRQMRDENGKLAFDGPLVRWIDSGTARKFQETVLAVLRRDHPGILNGSADHHVHDLLLGDGPPAGKPPTSRKRRPIARRESAGELLANDRLDDLWQREPQS